MGLDHIEWQYEVEDEFQVELPEAEVSAVRTPRQMADLVIRTKGLSAEPPQTQPSSNVCCV